MASARTSSAACLAALALGACATFGAPGAVAPDRPGYTDTPGVLPAHAVQMELGTTYDWTGGFLQGASNPAGPTGAHDYVSLGETLVRVGLGGQTELRLFGNSYGISDASDQRGPQGLEDPKIGLKRSLRAIPDSVHSWLPNAAVLLATTLPIGANALSAGKAQPEAKLAANWTTASPFSVYSNLAVAKVYSGSLQATREWLSTAFWFAANPRVSLFAEGIVVGHSSGQAQLIGNDDVDVGATFLINDRVQVDGRIGRGVGFDSKSHRFFGVGLAKRW